MRPEIGIGLVGFGTVGSGVYRILTRNASLIRRRVGGAVKVKGILVKDHSKRRTHALPRQLVVKHYAELLKNPEIQIIVELVGGVVFAKKIIIEALRAKKHVVTANKALIALHGKEIFQLAEKNNVDIFFEAAVGGGIPILRSIREGLAANHIRSIHAIVNGTCNFILTAMEEANLSFEAALQQAKAMGFAEADPRFDIEGTDAAHKLAILVGLSQGGYVNFKKIHHVGIKAISVYDIQMAKRFGYKIKLLAVAKSQGGKGIEAWVGPTLVPQGSMLAAVHGSNNAALVEGDYVGRTLFYGQGAGSYPTASAVVGDIMEVVRNLYADDDLSYTVPPLGHFDLHHQEANILPGLLGPSHYYLRFQVVDKPGVLGKITGILGRCGVGIQAVHQDLKQIGKKSPVALLTHVASQDKLKKAVLAIDRLAVVFEPTLVMPVEPNL